MTDTPEFFSEKQRIADPAFASKRQDPIDPNNAPSTGTPLGWMPEGFIQRWIAANQDKYRVVGEQDFANGRSVCIMLHPEAKIDISRLETQVREHGFKAPGQYFQRLIGERLVDTPVFIVFLTKNRTSPPKMGA